MKSFDGKVAIVTGGGGDGIGNALVNELAKAGATVAFCDIKDLDKTEAELTALGATFLAETTDMADRSAIDRFVDHVIERYGRIDLVVNNAGIPLGDRTFGEVTPQDMQRITDINYWGVIHTTMRCYPHLLTRPEAAIVNISSSQGIMGLPYLVPYCTTKFAVRGFTDSLRAEHRIRGVKNVSVHTVHPGAVATNITLNADYVNSGSQGFHEQLQKGTPPQEAARVILTGVLKGRGRIFISDGRAQDVLTRLLPNGYVHAARLMMRLRKIDVR
ncbi:SDR family NAD(P)-dependent oxidoreductase [Arthrobacter sp. NEB 688]|uniref:SDR family NAD(P)-dependent oxidoreductase n=1 Tax=Arthrobacter sp. NEB 688 TaxID=904039 RepID=UPI0015670EB3|nr:SDR family NAD(P)-dependent oxidoreductase [Arthrobacter sp. NEB 688]QKE84499.1 SDR family oxidoreductase [Arthrobacter sp. NEB 688]